MGTGEPPRRSRSGMITAIVIGAVLVLAGGGTGVYFLTKGDDNPSPSSSSSSSSQNIPPTKDSESPPTGSGSAPPPASGGQAPTAEVPPTSGESGGGGGSGGGTGSPEDDAKITEIAQKYASAVTNKDEGAAKSVTCDKETGLLFNDVQKVEVTGKPEKYGDDTASIGVKITIPEQDPIDNFPLFMGKESNVWCISN